MAHERERRRLLFEGEVGVVAGLDVLEELGRVERRMDDGEVVAVLDELERADVLLVLLGKRLSGPKGALPGVGVEEVDVQLVDGGEVVIPRGDGGLKLVADLVDALDRIGAVADQVAHGDVLLHALLLHLLDDGVEGLEVGVDISQDPVFHGLTHFPLLEEGTRH
jgi:hypothetical protein